MDGSKKKRREGGRVARREDGERWIERGSEGGRERKRERGGLL